MFWKKKPIKYERDEFAIEIAKSSRTDFKITDSPNGFVISRNHVGWDELKGEPVLSWRAYPYDTCVRSDCVRLRPSFQTLEEAEAYLSKSIAPETAYYNCPPLTRVDYEEQK